jgi:hypothetical protein
MAIDTSGKWWKGQNADDLVEYIRLPVHIVCLEPLDPVRVPHPESPAHSRRLEVPEKRSTEAEIAQHIVGEWKIADNSDGCWYPVMIIAQDGTLTGAQSSGTKVLLGTWEFANHALRVTPTPARLKAARASGSWMNDWDWYPVVYADDHELVMTPGISMAGRWRYKR